MSKHLRKFETEAEYSAATIYRPSVSLISDEMTVIFDPKPHDYSQDYLTFVSLEDGTFSWSGSSSANCLSYSLDSGATWSEPSSAITTSTLSSGDTVLWKGSGMSPLSNKGIGTFSSTTEFNAEGNIMSLLFGDNFSGQTDLTGYNNAFVFLFNGLYDYGKIVNAENLILPASTMVDSCYDTMFYNCTSLTTAPVLPATTLSQNCYKQMFFGCTSLTTAPELLATTLADYCYGSMFRGCTSLTAAPVLPATTLAKRCYDSMFIGCTNLNSITCLATDKSANRCTYSWVNGVAANGTFTKAASMSSWTTGASGIPSGWTVQDYTR